MNTIVQKSLHGCVGQKIQGWINQFGVAVIGAACFTAALSPTTASAAQVSHLQYIQTMVQALGDAGQFNAGSSAADYIQWAKNKGMTPNGGWSAGSTMNAEAVALTWVQLLGLNPNKFGRDYFRNLDSAGIHINPNAAITPEYVISLLDQESAQDGLRPHATAVTSPTKPGNGVGFGLGWYKKNAIVPPAVPPGPPPGAGSNGNGRGGR